MLMAVTADTHEDPLLTKPEQMDEFWEKLADEKPDFVLHAGDWGATADEVPEAMLRARSFLKCPIVTAPGNHDLWTRQGPPTALKRFDDACHAAEIYNGPNFPKEFGDYTVISWLWWYKELNPPTNDAYWMGDSYEGVPIHEYMRKLSRDSQQEVVRLSLQYKNIILLGHSSPPDGLMRIVLPKIVVEGHWHTHRLDTVLGVGTWAGVRHINPGSDYGTPRFLLAEL